MLVAERGDETPIEWVHRERRYGEKLATPDTSIADLIGEVDPIKVAEGRYLSDELTIHYGLVPRTNRGIFAINELPDLAERIQVGLLNVLEERDVQIRGYKIRLPLDLMLVASANPEDYTNRGRIITPLKDRFGAQIRTHYPLDVDVEMDVVELEASRSAAGGGGARARVHDRDRGRDHASRRAARRTSTSGPACRCGCRSRTTRRSSPTRRGGRCATSERGRAAGERPRRAGVEHRGQDRVRDRRRRAGGAGARPHREAAVLETFGRGAGPRAGRPWWTAFDEGLVVHTGADVPAAEYAGLLSTLPGLPNAGGPRGGWRPPAVASASSSCSRACTCRSASTRTPSAPKPPTAA